MFLESTFWTFVSNSTTDTQLSLKKTLNTFLPIPFKLRNKKLRKHLAFIHYLFYHDFCVKSQLFRCCHFPATFHQQMLSVFCKPTFSLQWEWSCQTGRHVVNFNFQFQFNFQFLFFPIFNFNFCCSDSEVVRLVDTWSISIFKSIFNFYCFQFSISIFAAVPVKLSDW